MDEVDVINERWDYLIVLDACRFDFFAETYRDYLDGVLMMKKSLGTSTNEWRDKCFPGYYDDIIYISANPQISARSQVYGYCAGEHFHGVYEVWNDCWNKELGTVLPDVLRHRALQIIRNTRGAGKRYIIHFLQPHSPYLCLADKVKAYVYGDVDRAQRITGALGGGRSLRARRAMIRCCLKILKRNGFFFSPPEWFLRRWLKMPAVNPMEAALRSVDRDGLRDAYRQNLRAVLKETAALVAGLSGRIVVTSDHGELLGERFCYGHPTGSNNPILYIVPWLVVDRPPSNRTSRIDSEAKKKAIELAGDTSPEAEREELAAKLKALGYYD